MIERGYVRIESCDKLCFAKTVEWERLTPIGKVNFIAEGSNHCPDTTACRFCDIPHCWSRQNCQKVDKPQTGLANSKYERHSLSDIDGGEVKFLE